MRPPSPEFRGQSLIFVVDDDKGFSRLLEKTLQREGLATAGAGSFQEAVAWLGTHNPDLMLLDLKLQDIGGKELVDYLTVNGRSVPFIIMTGQGDERVAVAMMKRGAMDYLVKDADFLQFVPEVVRRALGQLERDRKLAAAEEALRRSEANLLKAQQIAHLGSYELNVPSSVEDYLSDEIYRILGLDRDGFESSNAGYIQRMVHPDDRERYQSILARAVQQAQPFEFEYRVVRADGSVRHVQSIGEPILDEAGVVVKLVGTLLDITERKRAEEASRKEHAFSSAVLDTSAALVVVLDRDARILRFNRACEQLTGYSAKEVRGKRLWNVVLDPEEIDSVKTVFANLCAGQFPSRHENYWLTREGERRLISWSNSALADDQGRVDYLIGIGIDVTDRKRLEQEILQISELEQRRIGQDLHDGLCQHLAGTELMTQILEQKIARKSKADAARVAAIAQHVREAISQTRLLARGLSPVVLESEGLMSALEELAASTAKMFRVTCEFCCATPVLVHEHVMATHLYRIAQEAISNAIRHGKAKHIRISLATVGDWVRLEIRDDGGGLQKDLAKAKGMGLRIMQYRAAIIGASLTVENRRECGAIVLCSVPQPARGIDSGNDDPDSKEEKLKANGIHC